ncbi:MAG TPA: pesticidal protein Cry7Aa [Patescibacteria group bacterium]|nr:pesticidal protein Cry7Aa [Patescibacteria group bacterium]
MDIEGLGIILEPTAREFENQAVLNPACLLLNGTTHLYYRAVHRGNFSTIGYCQLRDGRVTKRLDHPLLEPEYHYESHGLEDPRLVVLDGVYYLFYTAFDGENVHTAYATGTDPLHFEKQGVISPSLPYEEALRLLPPKESLEKYRRYGKHYEEVKDPGVFLWEKDTLIFPKKINGRFMLLARIMPGIQIIPFDYFADLKLSFWKGFLGELDRHMLLQPAYWFETRKIGTGCPPLETPAGWLLIYHAVQETPAGNVYRAAAALLDLADPTRVIARLPEPLFEPDASWEKQGDTANVVFPTGATLDGDELIIYYGAADTRIAAKRLSLAELLAELKRHPYGQA